MAYVINGMGGKALPKTGETKYHAQLVLPDKGHAINGLVAWRALDLIIKFFV